MPTAISTIFGFFHIAEFLRNQVAGLRIRHRSHPVHAPYEETPGKTRPFPLLPKDRAVGRRVLFIVVAYPAYSYGALDPAAYAGSDNKNI